MLFGCKNCGGYFTGDEVATRKPPAHPWALTATGERALNENRAAGTDQSLCPSCGHGTLRSK